jgi:hypothetical protein
MAVQQLDVAVTDSRADYRHRWAWCVCDSTQQPSGQGKSWWVGRLHAAERHSLSDALL